ncbi:MAG: efflux transporter outer membrane subunit [Pirellulaceae bacterium]
MRINKTVLCCPVWGMLALAMLSTGCLVGPDHCDPGAPFADNWRQPLPEGVTNQPDNSIAWWTKFDDPVLSQLVLNTTQQNLTLGEAMERINEARAQRGVARGGLFPDIFATAGFTHQKFSDNGSPFGIPGFSSPAFDIWSTGLTSSWEIDVFGALRRTVEAADADIDVSIEEHNALLVSLQGEVGAAYIQARTLEQRILITQRNVNLQRRSVEITEDRLEAGTVSRLDVEQAKSNLFRTESALPLLGQELDQVFHRLSVLQGTPPQDLTEEILANKALPRLPQDIDVGLPIDLIRQRPDIRSAERQLAAQAARIGIATADLYPRFTLNGTFTVDATKVSKWFRSDSLAFSVGPAMRWNILSFGRVRNNIEVNRARWRQLVFAYQQSVLDASAEVEDALALYRHSLDRAEALRQAAEAARMAAEISEEQYRGGIIPFQTLLDAQRFQAELEDQYVESLGQIYASVIQLYQSLGGGWRDPYVVATPVNVREPLMPESFRLDLQNVEGELDRNDGLEPAEAVPAPLGPLPMTP